MLTYNHGYRDGTTSAKLSKPIHENWQKDKSNKLTHFNKDYHKGYEQGFVDHAGGIIPFCFVYI